jgi:Replication factor A protein 3
MTGMDASAPAPFVNREMLAQYVTRRVRLAGAVESMDDTSITVKAADDGAPQQHACHTYVLPPFAGHFSRHLEYRML